MALRKLALVLGAALLAGMTTSCFTDEYVHQSADEPIPGINKGDTPDDVKAVLGTPKQRANGWWWDAHTFHMDFEVWYYKGTGRVVFASRPEKLVYASESDPEEDGRPE